jgi:hypothetical protein
LMGHSAAGTPNSNTVAIDAKTGHLRHRRKTTSDAKIAKPNMAPKIIAVNVASVGPGRCDRVSVDLGRKRRASTTAPNGP